MKNKRRSPSLTYAEYEVMRVLWKHGKKPVREIHEILLPSQGWALTTIRTMLDRMANKKLVKKVKENSYFLFSPLVSRPAGLAGLVRFFASQVLETDASKVVKCVDMTWTNSAYGIIFPSSF